MQVRDLDPVVVDKGDAPHARSHERRHDRAAEAAGAQHDDVRFREAALPGHAESGQHALSGVPGRIRVEVAGHASILAGHDGAAGGMRVPDRRTTRSLVRLRRTGCLPGIGLRRGPCIRGGRLRRSLRGAAIGMVPDAPARPSPPPSRPGTRIARER